MQKTWSSSSKATDDVRARQGESTLSRRHLRFVLAWAELHQEEPRENWRLARAGAETGTVVWPGGADLAPDTLYERVRTGTWPGENLAA